MRQEAQCKADIKHSLHRLTVDYGLFSNSRYSRFCRMVANYEVSPYTATGNQRFPTLQRKNNWQTSENMVYLKKLDVKP